jgi:hypothetical protein
MYQFLLDILRKYLPDEIIMKILYEYSGLEHTTSGLIKNSINNYLTNRRLYYCKNYIPLLKSSTNPIFIYFFNSRYNRYYRTDYIILKGWYNSFLKDTRYEKMIDSIRVFTRQLRITDYIENIRENRIFINYKKTSIEYNKIYFGENCSDETIITTINNYIKTPKLHKKINYINNRYKSNRYKSNYR